MYSFGMQLCVLSIIQNLPLYFFYCCHHFLHMFSFDSGDKLLQLATIIIIGLIILTSIIFFFIIQYFYGNSSKNFLINVYRV